MIVIVGESACGKTSVANYLAEHYGYKKIITYTTRSPREGEQDGVDYYYVSNERFETLKIQNFFAETAIYNNWNYGSAREDYTQDSVIILTPKGLRAIRNSGIKNIFSVYIHVPRRDRLIKCLNRGDDIEEAYRRSLSDVGQFDGIKDEVDLVVYNPSYTFDVMSIAGVIQEKYEGI